jgi:hypothetical protein
VTSQVTAQLRPPHPWLAVIADYLDTLVQVIAFVAMILGGFCAGVAVLMMSIFPSSTHEQRAQTDQKPSTRDDHNDHRESDRRNNEHSFWNEYDKHSDEINDIGKNLVWDVHDDVMKDDQLVKELNSTMRAVEQGDEDPRKLKALQDEVYKNRQDKNRKDAKRDMLHGKFLDAQAKARNCFEMASIAQNSGDLDRADRLVSEGEAAWNQAKGIMADFRAV